MKASELKNGGLYLDHQGRIVRVRAVGEYMVAVSLDGKTCSFDAALCDDWQPLLTAEEWQAQHPLRLRKLGEGEELKPHVRYVRQYRKSGKWSMEEVFETKKTTIQGFDYYELPDLTAAESGTVSAVRTFDYELSAEQVKDVYEGREPAPAPSAVGERLTEPTEVKVANEHETEPLSDHRQTWTCRIGVEGTVAVPPGGDAPMRQAVKEAFQRVTGMNAHHCFSGWGDKWSPEQLEAIKSMKPEPPKYAIRINHSPHTWQYWSCNTEHGAGWRSTLDRQTLFSAEELTDQLLTLAKNGWLPCQATVITVDGPELAALFAESEVANG